MFMIFRLQRPRPSLVMPSPPEWNLIVCGGGSGGHLFPALAVADRLRKGGLPPRRVLFLTSQRVIESQVLQGEKVESIPLSGVSGRELRQTPWTGIPRLCVSMQNARQAIRGAWPAVALGTGGFASVPGIFAAATLRVPVILLEQNTVMGRANAWLRPLARTVCLSFDATGRSGSGRLIVTGNPVREEIARLAATQTPFDSRRTLLILGGSQGSRRVHDAVLQAVSAKPEMLQGWRVVHQAPASLCAEAIAAYAAACTEHRVAPFFDDLPTIYRQTGLVVSRAGATSLAEFACAGIPAVLIPDPNSVRDHQLLNARHYADRRAAVLVEERECVSEARTNQLVPILQELLSDTSQRAAMSLEMVAIARPGAAQEVATVVEGIVREKLRV